MLTTRSPNSYSEDNVDIFNHVSAKRFKLYDELKLLEFHYKLLINSHRSPNEGFWINLVDININLLNGNLLFYLFVVEFHFLHFFFVIDWKCKDVL
jgi:hypothetical protein